MAAKLRAMAVVLGVLAVACKDEPGTVLPARPPADANEVIRIPAPPDAAPVAPWEYREIAELGVKIELPATATLAVRNAGGTSVADVNAIGVGFTLQELDRPGSFESVKKDIGTARLLLAEKGPGGHTFVYVGEGDTAQIVSVTRGRILCGSAGLDDASAKVVLRACRSIKK